jgi:hypothetical protein
VSRSSRDSGFPSSPGAKPAARRAVDLVELARDERRGALGAVTLAQPLRLALHGGPLTEADIVVGLVELLEIAAGIAREQGQDEIRDTTMEEAVKRRCPIKPWC